MKFINFLFLIFFSLYINSQELNTNVDTNYLKSNLNDSILTSRVFRNGDKIAICKTLNEWNVNNEKNIPSLFINKNEYYYNYRALKDERNIFPIGYKLPFFHEFNLSKNKTTFGSIDENGLIKADNENNYFWIADKYSDNIEYSNTIHLTKTSRGYTNELSPDLKVNGHVVFAIEDISESIKTKTYEYGLLMPEEVKNFNKQLLRSLPFPNKHKSNFGYVNLSANIDFDRNGVKKNELISLIPSQINYSNQKEIELKIQELLNNKLVIPQYENQYINSNYYFNHNIVFTKKEKKISSNHVYYYDNYSSGNSFKKIANEINRSSREFIIDTLPLYNKNIYLQLVIEKQEKYILKDTLSRVVLSKVKTYGSPLWSIFPGLGTLTVVDGNGVSDISGFSVGLFFTSFPIGLVAIGSYIYSSINYRKYLYSTDFSSSRYSKANNGHKLFLTSAAIYTLLGIIDFSISSTIKIKSQKQARKINTIIKNKYNGAFVLSNSVW
jgi:hypothetical protein